ncbi:CPXV216 protein [Cowpox virus]|uniref:CPXV216 protein n=1 Tax=Cowpox virus TaxID=10243 RepID=U5TEG5_COWPX|nr:CPXV216 protein [Cowpox virus]
MLNFSLCLYSVHNKSYYIPLIMQA